MPVMFAARRRGRRHLIKSYRQVKLRSAYWLKYLKFVYQTVGHFSPNLRQKISILTLVPAMVCVRRLP